MRDTIKEIYQMVDNKTDCNLAGARRFQMGYSTFQRAMLKPEHIRKNQLVDIQGFLVKWVEEEIKTKKQELTKLRKGIPGLE